jgi:hypothetical protein
MIISINLVQGGNSRYQYTGGKKAGRKVLLLRYILYNALGRNKKVKAP